MRFRDTKREKNNRPALGGWIYALLLLGVALLVWIWWSYREPSDSASPQTPRSALPPANSVPLDLPGTNAPVPETNVMASRAATNPTILVSPPQPEPASVLPVRPIFIPRLPQNGFEVQLALERRGISCGSLDGVVGSQTRAALQAFQEKEHLPVTGTLDAATRERLRLIEPSQQFYVVTTNELGRLGPVGATWLAKSQQGRLDYENILELLAERGHAHPNLIRALNPSVSWTNVLPGTVITLPNAGLPPIRSRAAVIRIRLSGKTLQALDGGNALLAHFPCSIARSVEKRPLGQLFVEEVALNPTYRFDPANFPESSEARRLGRPLTIAPGPNNPVGTAWIGLNRPGYGIHGSPRPEQVGRTESHGCFRLANWNAEYLAQMVKVGTPVFVEP